ncbi:MAG: hypothetical protein ABSA83_06695 [Verrucomicrobiota bacterium]|jgi:hypothetical protein
MNKCGSRFVLQCVRVTHFREDCQKNVYQGNERNGLQIIPLTNIPLTVPALSALHRVGCGFAAPFALSHGHPFSVNPFLAITKSSLQIEAFAKRTQRSIQERLTQQPAVEPVIVLKVTQSDFSSQGEQLVGDALVRCSFEPVAQQSAQSAGTSILFAMETIEPLWP